MSTTMELEPAHDSRARWANLLLPGSGLVLIDRPVTGLVVGLAFAACANFALLAVLVLPDEFSAGERALGIGLTAGAYIGAQLRLAQTVRGLRAEAATLRRRASLREAHALMDRGEHVQALTLMDALSRDFPDDLLVAYRVAQLLTAVEGETAAQAAWERLRSLDHHGIYRDQIRAHTSGLGAGFAGSRDSGLLGRDSR